MALSVNWATKVITVPKEDLTLIQSNPTEIRELDVNAFRLELKGIEESEDGMPHLDTHSHNTEVTLGGLTFARVFELINGYTVTFENGQYAVNLVGANNNIGDNVNVNQVSVRSSNSAGLISSPDIEFSSFNGGVTIDSDSGISGTVFPRGTERMKVDNLSDAKLIADYRGFNKLYFHSDLTIDSGLDLEEFIFVGQSPESTSLVIEPSAEVERTVIQDCTVSGTLDGYNSIERCVVGDLDYVNGSIYECKIHGEIKLGGGQDAHILNCQQYDMDLNPSVDLGGSGQDLVMPNYIGIVILKNSTSVDNKVGIGLNGGVIMLDTSTFTHGFVHVSGIGKLTDTMGNAILSGTWNDNVTVINELLSKTTIAEAVSESYQSKVYIDVANGSSGTNVPLGTEKHKVNNLADALVIAAREQVHILDITGTLTVQSGEDISGFTLIADRSLGNQVIVNSGAITDGTYFENLTVGGTMNGSVRYTTSVITGVTNFDGGAKNSLLVGDITITGTGSNYFTDCDTYVTDYTTSRTISLGANTLNIIRCRGNYKLTDKTSTNTTAIDLVAGRVTVDSTCTAGTVTVGGVADVIDESGAGCTVNNCAVSLGEMAKRVWNSELSDHTTEDTPGELLPRIATKGDVWAR